MTIRSPGWLFKTAGRKNYSIAAKPKTTGTILAAAKALIPLFFVTLMALLSVAVSEPVEVSDTQSDPGARFQMTSCQMTSCHRWGWLNASRDTATVNGVMSIAQLNERMPVVDPDYDADALRPLNQVELSLPGPPGQTNYFFKPPPHYPRNWGHVGVMAAPGEVARLNQNLELAETVREAIRAYIAVLRARPAIPSVTPMPDVLKQIKWLPNPGQSKRRSPAAEKRISPVVYALRVMRRTLESRGITSCLA